METEALWRMGETMTDYDHIAAALIILAIIVGLCWRALDRRIYGPERHEMLPTDWEKRG